MPSNIFDKKTRLPKRERSYCSCLLRVREKSKINPYGVCTNTIYNRHGKRRPIVDCTINYIYENIPIEQLRALAKERKISIYSYNKKTKTRALTQNHILIRRLEDDIISKKSRRTHKKINKSKKID
jgi:hypothetical protein